MANPFGKTRDVNSPYAVYQSVIAPGWEWRVLKTYKAKASEIGDPYARWFVAVKSPMTYGSWEYGDTYISDIKVEARAFITDCTPEWKEIYG